MVGEDLAIHVGFPHGAGDQLGVLGAKIKDDDLFRHKCCEGK
jgi:hypothetical protein